MYTTQSFRSMDLSNDVCFVVIEIPFFYVFDLLFRTRPQGFNFKSNFSKRNFAASKLMEIVGIVTKTPQFPLLNV